MRLSFQNKTHFLIIPRHDADIQTIVAIICFPQRLRAVFPDSYSVKEQDVPCTQMPPRLTDIQYSVSNVLFAEKSKRYLFSPF